MSDAKHVAETIKGLAFGEVMKIVSAIQNAKGRSRSQFDGLMLMEACERILGTHVAPNEPAGARAPKSPPKKTRGEVSAD